MPSEGHIVRRSAQPDQAFENDQILKTYTTIDIANNNDEKKIRMMIIVVVVVVVVVVIQMLDLLWQV